MALIGAKYIEGLVILGMFLLAAQTAYTIRLYAIINYGRVIHGELRNPAGRHVGTASSFRTTLRRLACLLLANTV